MNVVGDAVAVSVGDGDAVSVADGLAESDGDALADGAAVSSSSGVSSDDAKLEPVGSALGVLSTDGASVAGDRT
jgi:hypothetical protein